MGKATIWRMVVAVIAAAAILPCLASGTAYASAPAAFAKIANHDSKGTYAQGAAIDDRGRYTYVVKQKQGSHVNLQRIDMRTGKSKRLALSSAAKRAISHGNGLAYAKVRGKAYLFAAPARNHQWVALLAVSGKRASYKGRVYVSGKVVKAVQKLAVEKVSGNKVTMLVGKGGTIKRIKIDVSKRKRVTKGTAIRGFKASHDQGISVSWENGTDYVYGCGGGWTTARGNVTKWRVSGKRLVRVWTKTVAGEPETAIMRGDKVYVIVEGGTRYNKRHHCRFYDRITAWSVYDENYLRELFLSAWERGRRGR